jgi:hypothetical protein
MTGCTLAEASNLRNRQLCSVSRFIEKNYISRSAKLNVNYNQLQWDIKGYDLQINTKMYRPNNTKSCRNKETEQVRISLIGWDWASYIGIKYCKNYRQLKMQNKSNKNTLISSEMNYMFPPNVVIIRLASRKKRHTQLYRG